MPKQPKEGDPKTLFVTDYPLHWGEEPLKKYFSQFGEITNIFVKLARGSHKTTYGFIEYKDLGCTDKALAIPSHVINGVKLIVERAKKRNDSIPKSATSSSFKEIRSRICIKQVPKEVTDTDIKSYFSKYGDVESVFIYTNHEDDSGDMAFINFKNERDALETINREHTIKGNKFIATIAITKSPDLPAPSRSSHTHNRSRKSSSGRRSYSGRARSRSRDSSRSSSHHHHHSSYREDSRLHQDIYRDGYYDTYPPPNYRDDYYYSHHPEPNHIGNPKPYDYYPPPIPGQSGSKPQYYPRNPPAYYPSGENTYPPPPPPPPPPAEGYDSVSAQSSEYDRSQRYNAYPNSYDHPPNHIYNEPVRPNRDSEYPVYSDRNNTIAYDQSNTPAYPPTPNSSKGLPPQNYSSEPSYEASRSYYSQNRYNYQPPPYPNSGYEANVPPYDSSSVERSPYRSFNNTYPRSYEPPPVSTNGTTNYSNDLNPSLNINTNSGVPIPYLSTPHDYKRDIIEPKGPLQEDDNRSHSSYSSNIPRYRQSVLGPSSRTSNTEQYHPY